MKHQMFFAFFTVFFSLYFIANYYIFFRGWQALPDILILKKVYISLFILFAFSFVIGRFSERILPVHINHVFIWIGSFWLGAMLYLFLIVLSVDIVRLFNFVFHFLPSYDSPAYVKMKFVSLIISIELVAAVMVLGFINANYTRIRHYTIVTEKKFSINDNLKIAVVTDIHLGTLVGKNRLRKLTRMVNSQEPDIIILAGDILDEVQTPIVTEDIGAPLKNLKARLGVYAITGNHEYIGGINRAVKYIETLGVKILRDSAIELDNKFVLIGREDRDMERFTGKKRKTKTELMKGIDSSKFLILLDHQPFDLKKTVELNIDLQISGHTHDGQLWPFNYLTDAIYELSSGYLVKGNTHFFVSSGFGTWGPPVRIGTASEIGVIAIKNLHKAGGL
jgi:uncharacterized protein